MKRFPALLALCLATAALAPANAGAQDLALTHVTIVDVESGGLRADQTVLIRDSRIAWTGPSREARIPSGARTVDATGRYAIPGLWDMHVHTSREGRAAHFWPQFLAYGVTGVREMGSYLDSLQYWRGRARQPGSGAPRIVFSSPMLDGSPPAWRHGYGVADSAAAVAAVDTMAALGFDFLKVYARLPRDAYFSIARRARERGIPFAGHIPVSVTAMEAIDAGQRSIEHLNDDLYLLCVPGGAALQQRYLAARAPGAPADSVQPALDRLLGALQAGPGAAECAPLLRRMAAHGTWFTPTLTVHRGMSPTDELAADPRIRFVPPNLARRWESGRRRGEEARIEQRINAASARMVAMAQAAGVGILAGTDASDEAYVFAGSGLHDELALLVEAGLTPLQALQAATLNPARYLEAADSMGTVAAGKVADLLLLDADPLADIRNTMRIFAVVHGGRLIDAAERERLLRLAQDEAARAAVAPPARQPE
ncbi:amidohydrolase family protein [Longimicrobium sp.]|uniref:amidohydrolase family protein n=1 Tax=Longimicrobium sp. TaxID=2029185 RepID=UPI003B3B2398